jgi:RNA polymerase primary sigma factor
MSFPLCPFRLEPDQRDTNTRKIRNEKIDQVLSILDHLESEVIKLRYGLSDGYTYTIDEIGEQFGIKPERVAEIEQ